MQVQIPHIKLLGHVKFPALIISELGKLAGPHYMGKSQNTPLGV